jgi:hypothetical protein
LNMSGFFSVSFLVDRFFSFFRRAMTHAHDSYEIRLAIKAWNLL